jgi:glycerol dehydrogenase
LRAAIRRVAERATQPGETIHNMPFPVDAGMVFAAIDAADALGRAARAAAAG